jgi:hypothetical protein
MLDHSIPGLLSRPALGPYPFAAFPVMLFDGHICITIAA